MTRINFYTNVPDKIGYACRLIRKARSANCQVVVFAADHTQLAALDEALWTFSEQDFLPHVMAGDPMANRTPVILTDNPDAELPHHELLVNLSHSTPPHFARFQRLAEIVSAEETDANNGRDRYKFYKQRGYPLEHMNARDNA